MTSSANEATAKRTGQAAGFLEGVFANTDTPDFVGPVRCTAPAEGEGVSLEWPWNWMPATGSLRHCRWCRWRGRNRRLPRNRRQR